METEFVPGLNMYDISEQMDDAINLTHYCSECDESFQISKLLFEHKV